MKKIILLILVFIGLVFNIIYAQAQEPDKKLTGKEKRELNRQKALEEKKNIVQLLESNKWIIEIELVFGQQDQNMKLNPLHNFIGINGDLGIFKIIEQNRKVIEGGITDFEVIEGKERAQPIVKYHFQGRDHGSSLKADILITVNNEKRANITMRYDLGGSISYQGRIVPWYQSKVYKENY